MMAVNRISFPAFCRTMIDAGLIRAQSKPRRIVIDAHRGKVVLVYVEYEGDDRLLDVLFTLEGVRVQTGREPS